MKNEKKMKNENEKRIVQRKMYLVLFLIFLCIYNRDIVMMNLVFLFFNLTMMYELISVSNQLRIMFTEQNYNHIY